MAAERDAIAVLLMAYGGPDSLDDVEPYLLDVRGGRAVSPEFVAEVKARYARIGGRSPPRELTQTPAAGGPRLVGGRVPGRGGLRPLPSFIAGTGGPVVAPGARRPWGDAP